LNVKARYLMLALVGTGLVARGADPFAVAARLEQSVPGVWQVVVQVDVPAQHTLNADRLAVKIGGQEATGRVTPRPVSGIDPAGVTENVYTSQVTGVYRLNGAAVAQPVKVTVSLQGCSASVCFLPRTQEIVLRTNTVTAAAAVAPVVTGAVGAGHPWLAGVRHARSVFGYQGTQEFLGFLSATQPVAHGGLSGLAHDPAAFLKRQGFLWTVLLVLFGGLLLNLTPCVLPMIPINLAIIGAGVQARSRRGGFLLGAAYGAGMALAYGGLGVAAVLTGGVFGALQGSPFFSAAMAVLFLLFGLALFDVLPIDLSCVQKTGGRGGGWVAAMVAGGVSALLAGACVAPVVGAVLLLASSLVHGGRPAAVLLPLLLGVGMALPWPLAGAGLAVLPRPGAWMVRVKQLFAVLILAMACYYGWLAYGGFRQTPVAANEGNSLQAGDWEGWQQQVAVAKREGKPLLLDFHASWCKSCHGMDRTTFRAPDVQRVLADFRVVKLDAEQPDKEPARGMLRAFGVLGLPTYVVAEPAP